MADMFDNARRFPVMYKIGAFSDGTPKLARAPFSVLKMSATDTGKVETYIATSYGMADGPGVLMGEDGPENGLMDRDGFGWIDSTLITEEHLCGTGDNDTLFAQHRFAPL
jgi:hypothetical protein